ncbi:poly(A) polymerase gamma-like [Brevipalpus obovatus]|uniref:poly(A) polymerase gamma-like n=1 Tax=Brevipalpus obovatus TaxID=246614 RepID=UPI003D9EEBE4
MFTTYDSTEPYVPSIDCPSKVYESDVLTATLVDELVANHMFPTDNDRKRRQEALELFQIVVDKWVASLKWSKKGSDDGGDAIGIKVLPCGSYGLDCYNFESDIDLTMIATNHVTIDDFFTSFRLYLETEPDVTLFKVMRDVLTPNIKCHVKGIKIDAALSILPFSTLPATDFILKENYFVKDMTSQSVRALNSWRDCQYIIKYVPDLAQFRILNRAIKLWTNRRCIKSAMLTYLSSFAWTIMAAKICHDYPHERAGTLLKNFFQTYSVWPWHNPIRINPSDDLIEDLGDHEFWEPGKKKEEMIVLHPSYPRRNDTFKVTQYSHIHIVDELARGVQLVTAIDDWDVESWKQLFHNLDFFKLYDHFVVISCEDWEDWAGVVSSRIPRYVANLSCHMHIKFVHLFTARFTGKLPMSSDYFLTPAPTTRKNEKSDRVWLLGIAFDSEPDPHYVLDLNYYHESFENAVRMYAIWSYDDTFRVASRHLRKNHLNRFLFEEEMKVYGYDPADIPLEPHDIRPPSIDWDEFIGDDLNRSAMDETQQETVDWSSDSVNLTSFDEKASSSQVAEDSWSGLIGNSASEQSGNVIDWGLDGEDWNVTTESYQMNQDYDDDDWGYQTKKDSDGLEAKKDYDDDDWGYQTKKDSDGWGVKEDSGWFAGDEEIEDQEEDWSDTSAVATQKQQILSDGWSTEIREKENEEEDWSAYSSIPTQKQSDFTDDWSSGIEKANQDWSDTSTIPTDDWSSGIEKANQDWSDTSTIPTDGWSSGNREIANVNRDWSDTATVSIQEQQIYTDEWFTETQETENKDEEWPDTATILTKKQQIFTDEWSSENREIINVNQGWSETSTIPIQKQQIYTDGWPTENKEMENGDDDWSDTSTVSPQKEQLNTDSVTNDSWNAWNRSEEKSTTKVGKKGKNVSYAGWTDDDLQINRD